MDTGLGRGRRLRAYRQGVRALQASFQKINRRPRASKGGRCANELEKMLPHWRTRVSRRAFYYCVQAAIHRAAAGLKGRAARTAERKAIFGVLTTYKLARVSGPHGAP